ncbi:hypothetical protein [Nannocystis punicea]|uniref:Uncharacterized protein n=1 Tax=Nannocystis punicea TaxID=2995304 RepID=A0ABY7H8R6_9BACT|nr:hypothetical protein [Nannocystis poenicansa]WAS95379.1 hypothetical protein O0S08_04400 [Nannocystis poenicansa]
MLWTTVAVGTAVLASSSQARSEPPASSSAAVLAPSPIPPTKCEPLPPFAGSKQDLQAAAEALVARGKQLPHGGRERLDIKIEVMTLFARAGDLDMCKLLRQTRDTSSLSAKQQGAIGCVQQQFCQPMPLPRGCPAGMRNDGPEGCAPTGTCSAAAVGAQVAACNAGETVCCAPALLMLEVADAQAGLPTPESLAKRRALAKLGCDRGHAELCVEAAALGVGTLDSQRKRACTLGHVASCKPPGEAK